MGGFAKGFISIFGHQPLIMVKGGAYILLLHLQGETRVRVGRLGEFTFPPGWYAYVGSARKGLKARASRHLTREKHARWHIDYLTPHATEIRVVLVPSREPPECFLSKHVLETGKIVVKGFGASDCPCPSHLAYLGESSIRRTHSAGTWCNSPRR